MFNQMNPSAETGPPITVPRSPVVCWPRGVLLIVGVGRTLTPVLFTWTRSLSWNLVEGVAISNVAVTVVSAFSVSVQVPACPAGGGVPLHPPPLQPAKVEPLAGVAVRVETVPGVTPETEQVAPQLMEPPVTVPVPVPAFVMEREKVVGGVAE